MKLSIKEIVEYQQEIRQYTIERYYSGDNQRTGRFPQVFVAPLPAEAAVELPKSRWCPDHIGIPCLLITLVVTLVDPPQALPPRQKEQKRKSGRLLLKRKAYFAEKCQVPTFRQDEGSDSLEIQGVLIQD